MNSNNPLMRVFGTNAPLWARPVRARVANVWSRCDGTAAATCAAVLVWTAVAAVLSGAIGSVRVTNLTLLAAGICVAAALAAAVELAAHLAGRRVYGPAMPLTAVIAPAFETQQVTAAAEALEVAGDVALRPAVYSRHPDVDAVQLDMLALSRVSTADRVLVIPQVGDVLSVCEAIQVREALRMGRPVRVLDPATPPDAIQAEIDRAVLSGQWERRSDFQRVQALLTAAPAIQETAVRGAA